MAKAGDRYECITGNIWSYAKRGDLTGAKAALLRGVDVDLQNTVGWTALHAAANSGDVKMIKFLLREGASIELRDRGGNLAIHEAARNGHVNALAEQRQLAEAGADLGEVRLSQTKGAAVRSLVTETLRKASKRGGADKGGEERGEEQQQQAVGYARVQVKSNALYGPRKTPISCKIKKQILQQKRQKRGTSTDEPENNTLEAEEESEREANVSADDGDLARNKLSEMVLTSADDADASELARHVSDPRATASDPHGTSLESRGRKTETHESAKSWPAESYLETVQSVKRERNRQRRGRRGKGEEEEELEREEGRKSETGEGGKEGECTRERRRGRRRGSRDGGNGGGREEREEGGSKDSGRGTRGEGGGGGGERGGGDGSGEEEGGREGGRRESGKAETADRREGGGGDMMCSCTAGRNTRQAGESVEAGEEENQGLEIEEEEEEEEV